MTAESDACQAMLKSYDGGGVLYIVLREIKHLHFKNILLQTMVFRYMHLDKSGYGQICGMQS